jgi:Flp pilus assembly protein TadD
LSLLHLYKAKALDRLGRAAEADAEYRKTAELDPSGEETEKKLPADRLPGR